MADPTSLVSQMPTTAQVSETLQAVAWLAPAAQIAALASLGVVAALFVWTRRPQQAPGGETVRLVIAALTEQAEATNALAKQVEKIVEQNAVIIARLPAGRTARPRKAA